MNLGNKILNLRKKHNLSQEELAEKVGVTRQTISKWELEETSPDITQAKKLSKIFNVSLDELTNNDINDILVEKVSNTEKLAGITIKILKGLGICFILFIVFDIIVFLAFLFLRIKNNSVDREIKGKYSITCTLDGEEYLFETEYNRDYQIIYAGGDGWIMDHTDVDRYENANKARAHIEDWFKEHNGSCTTKEEAK